MKLFSAFAVRWMMAVAVMVLSLAARAEDAHGSAAARRMENRFLFVVDTSSGMSHSTNAVVKAVVGLLQSDIGGQLRDGDTIGIWTFSDKLHLSEKDKNHPLFPMQIWHDDVKTDIGRRMVNYLHFQKYEKKSDLKKVLPELYSRISGSQTFTAIIISDGSNPITGTPFDDDINDLQKRFGAEFRAANLPLVTVLAAREGEIFDYTVNSGADAIRIPQTAAPIVAKVITNVPPPPPPPEPKHIEIVVSPKTNSVTGRGEVVIKPEPVVVAPASKKMAEPTFGSDVSPGVAEVIKLFANKVGESSLLAYVNNYPKPFAPSADEILLLHDSGVPDQVIAAMVSHKPSEKTSATPPAPAAEHEIETAHTNPPPIAPAVPVAPEVTKPAVTAPAAPMPLPAAKPVVAATPAGNPAMLIIAFSLLAVAVILIVVLLRRPKAPQPSLISQSINRKD